MFELGGPLPPKQMHVVISIEVPVRWEEGYAVSELAGIVNSIGARMLYGHQLSGEITYNSRTYSFEIEDEL